MSKEKKSNYESIPRVREDVSSALAKRLDRNFDNGTPRDIFYDSIMNLLKTSNPEIIKFVKDRCGEFGENNPEYDPDYIDGYFQGARETMINVVLLLYSQIENNNLRASFRDLEKWRM